MDFVGQKLAEAWLKLCLDVSREAAIRYRMDLHSSENLTGNGGSTSEVAHS